MAFHKAIQVNLIKEENQQQEVSRITRMMQRMSLHPEASMQYLQHREVVVRRYFRRFRPLKFEYWKRPEFKIRKHVLRQFRRYTERGKDNKFDF